ncbi:metallophosphoesterase [Mesorhizobium sp. M6A.T.Ce.TU.002.03.1.1]|uniref:metallophosphoesterase n=1 Tax=Mesorhizobium sp. M6A.T.Ce.TU.002.03.1.1 TaxID=2496782 RepID=UPI0013DFFBCE|nr:metallophosphoesterase [Mesorhizobium sp. M6A.T.Ce.TU.002.03.1.1]
MKAAFVHLSDIHFGQERDGGTNAENADAKKRLIEDARAEVGKLGGKVHGVIVTGDIAYSGNDDEYTLAGQWLADLTDAIGCERSDVQMIPGNHDIDRGKITDMIETILFAIREGGDEWLDRNLDNQDSCKVLYERFDAYKGFALDYRCELDLNGGISTSARLELAPGRAVRFVRLNSALICSNKKEEGKLILGARQRTLPMEEGEEFVVLSHHPLHWFQDSEKARGFLRGRARVFISGHEHFPKLEIVDVENGCQLMMLAAGATAPDQIDDRYTYKYNILAFEWDGENDALAVSLNPRTWDGSVARFRRDDEFMDGKDERQVLGSPNFRRAPKPSVHEELAAAVGDLVEEPLAAAGSEAPDDEHPAAAPAQTGEAGEAGIELVEAEPSQDVRDLQLRFFQELSQGARLTAFVDFGVVAQIKGRIDHAMERRLFRRAVRQGMAKEIEQLLDEAKSGKGGSEE